MNEAAASNGIRVAPLEFARNHRKASSRVEKFCLVVFLMPIDRAEPRVTVQSPFLGEGGLHYYRPIIILRMSPVPCTVTVVGYQRGQKVASKPFKYSPSVAVTAPKVMANLSGPFKGIDKAAFWTTYSISAAGATLLDNLSYVAFGLKQQGRP